MRFVLDEVAGLPATSRLPGLEHATPEIVDQVLLAAARLASEVLAPLNAVGDRTGSVLENGVVRMPPGFREAYRQFADGGWNGLVFPAEWGGQDLPWTLGAAVAEMWNAANLTFQICPLLTQAVIDALLHHGTPEHKAVYLEPLIAGRWTGAMGLTEPQAGTDLGAVRTRAVPTAEGYRIVGQKIYISYGDHDMAENIVHLVLARLPDAPAGSRGLSLFVVPKLLPDANGQPGRRNDMRPLKLEHKLGLHASPTCVMAYGEDGGATGFLLGEPHAGLRCMFTMVNKARLAVGHEGLGLAERAYQQALAYARERVQGQIAGRPVAILAYPDVRRMLLTMRAQIAAMRALAYWTAGFVDRAARAVEPAERAAAAGRVALLTPIVKAWCTDCAQEIATLAVQVHGGMGFIEETGVAQYYREARILSIYEGTNGVQALDLVARKLAQDDGRLPWLLLEELRADLSRLPEAPALDRALATLERATRIVQAAPEEVRAAASTPYLRLIGQVLGAFLLGRGAACPAAPSDWAGLHRFYVRHLLPPAVALGEVVAAGADDLDAAALVG
jgi:alkylation response protein AidB-like acyl-CoA dehydrogenase